MDNFMPSEVILEVSDFVVLVNQTFEYAYPSVTIRGEVANFRISKNKWVYFDLKDENATVRFFGTVYQLPGPLEDGMMLRVRGIPKLHNLYGFSVTILNIRPEGEGALRRAAELLRAKLQAEGLFSEARKRPLPYPPARLGLITSTESAAYIDFIKILNARWQGLEIECIDVQVQGGAAPDQIVAAIEHFNQMPMPPDILVLTRGGGSQDDLYTFDTEQVTRAVSASRVPTLVAIGHERDVSLSEMAADQRASTPSNAAELLVPDRNEVLRQLETISSHLDELVINGLRMQKQMLKQYESDFDKNLTVVLKRLKEQLVAYSKLLEALNPRLILKRGYSIVRIAGAKKIIRSKKEVESGDIVDIELSDGQINATVR